MRKLRRGALALLVGALWLSVGAGPAHANDTGHATQQFTFNRASTGQAVTCTVDAYLEVFGTPQDARREANASLKGYGDDPACGDGTASITATYRNSSGVSVRDSASGDRATSWNTDDVGTGSPNLSIENQYSFSDCASACSLTFTTAPK